MTRQLVGAILIASATVLYGLRYLAAAVIVADNTGDLQEQYRAALASVGGELSAFAVVALVAGLAYVAWGEFEHFTSRR